MTIRKLAHFPGKALTSLYYPPRNSIIFLRDDGILCEYRININDWIETTYKVPIHLKGSIGLVNHLVNK